MATKVIEITICDRCKKELHSDNDIACVTDPIDHYFYDLCKGCYEDYILYKRSVEELWEEQKRLADKHRFGKCLFENKEGDNK